MAARDLTKILRTPGRLVKDPSTNVAFPYGGTELGAVDEVVLRVRQNVVLVHAEEFREDVEGIVTSQQWELDCNLRAALADDDVKTLLFLNTDTGASSGEEILVLPGAATQLPGAALLSASGFELAFIPDDTTNHYVIQMHRALPVIRQDAEITFGADGDAVLPVRFVAIRSASDAQITIAKKEDVTFA